MERTVQSIANIFNNKYKTSLLRKSFSIFFIIVDTNKIKMFIFVFIGFYFVFLGLCAELMLFLIKCWILERVASRSYRLFRNIDVVIEIFEWNKSQYAILQNTGMSDMRYEQTKAEKLPSADIIKLKDVIAIDQ